MPARSPLSRAPRHGESYLLVLVTGRKIGIDTLRLLGDPVLVEAGPWDTLRVLLAAQLKTRASQTASSVPGALSMILRAITA